MKNKKRKDTVSIGGQAVMEGVMMKSASSMATAVRDADGIIRVETERLDVNAQKNSFLKFPVVRGVVAFFSSLISGTKTLMRSAEVFGEGEPSKFEKWCAEKLKINVISVVSVFSAILGLLLAVALFMLAPQRIRIWIIGENCNPWAKNFLEGGIKIVIFICYILLCYLLKDVRRTFMYHGAEHKTISCYEKGLELTPENAKKCTRVHNRCGTTFIFFVMFISIIIFACFESVLKTYAVDLNGTLRVLCKVALLPLVAGLSYELLKGLSKTDCWVFYPLKAPGLLLQRLTTKEPTEDMLEVAIKAFNTVLEMDRDKTIEPVKFTVSKKRKELLEEVYQKLKLNGIEEKAEAEWIVSILLNVKRDELYNDTLVTPKYIDRINAVVNQRITGRPLWYCIGDTDFYGYKIKVDERVLIPRPETELLVENALKVINSNSKVLDLCTGSGAIAIVVSRKKNIRVTATDISSSAIVLAKENASLNKAEVEFIESDMFCGIEGKTFDVIISNPPYVKREEIEGLQKEVKDFEPHLALNGGEDGLDFYRIISLNVCKFLNNGGVLLMECGENQAEDIKEMLKGFTSVEIIKDYEGIDRIIKAVL